MRGGTAGDITYTWLSHLLGRLPTGLGEACRTTTYHPHCTRPTDLRASWEPFTAWSRSYRWFKDSNPVSWAHTAAAQSKA